MVNLDFVGQHVAFLALPLFANRRDFATQLRILKVRRSQCRVNLLTTLVDFKNLAETKQPDGDVL